MGITGPDGRGYVKNSQGEVVAISEVDGRITPEGIKALEERSELINIVLNNEKVGGKENNSDLN